MYEEKVIDIDSLFLDENNYRIDFERYNTLPKVIERLYLDEKINEMINGIVNFPGIYPHEKLIVIPKGDGKYKVLEGNRRVLAIKSLLGEIEPPPKFKREVTAASAKLSDETKESLKHIGAIVYDIGDKGYLKILANKHSSISYQRWGQISQWHFFNDLYDLNKKDIDLTAKDLGKSKAEVANYIRYYNLFSYIRSLLYWDENNLRDVIESNTLKATKFTRPLGFTDVRKALRLEFDEEFNVKILFDDINGFNQILCKYAQASLIDDKSDDDFIYTRSEPGQVVELIEGWKKEIGISEKKIETEGKTGTSGQSKGTHSTESNKKGNREKETKHKKPAVYFEDLKCAVDDQRLKKLTTELIYLSKSSRMDKLTISGVMLTRALLESCLLYQVKKVGKFGDYKKSLVYENDGKTFVSPEGLKNLVGFVLKNVDDIFSKTNVKSAKKALEELTSSRLDYLNSIVHGSWLDPTPEKIRGIAGDMRELLRVILGDTA